MKNILIIGTGLSSYYLIKYLDEQAQKNDWQLTLADLDLQAIGQKKGSSVEAIELNVLNEEKRDKAVSQSDLVISMLPAEFHSHVARSCLKFGKSLLTASYETEEVKNMHMEALNKGILFLNEMGLDP